MAEGGRVDAWQADRPRRGWLRRDDLPLLLAYGLLFHGAHTLAAWWGGPGFYSLWFPAAGLRFALLWVFGARLTPAVVLAELAVQLLAGVLRIGAPDALATAISIARPALAYGLAIAAVRWLTRQGRSPLSTAPMPFGFAAVLAPVSAALAALPWSLLQPGLTGVASGREVVSSLAAFVTGDLLGVLLLAPPAIYLAELWLGRQRFRPERPTARQLLEWGGVLGTALLVLWLLAALRIVYSGMPLVLAACWIGLRFGRVAAWATNVTVAAIVFPLTMQLGDINSRLDLHMAVAAMAVAGYVAASLAAASRHSLAEITRRDRLLFHAERLRTLRAMSVAVIHEVSQPLSTLVLETRHLRQSVERDGDPGLVETAQLVEAKTSALAEMTRRLRDFGSRGEEAPSSFPLGRCIDDAVALLAHEARGARLVVQVSDAAASARVRGNGLELTQGLVNLLRNSLQASRTGSEVLLTAMRGGSEVRIALTNEIHASAAPKGMGVGSIIARAIIEAAGGRIRQRRPQSGLMVTDVSLPLEQAR